MLGSHVLSITVLLHLTSAVFGGGQSCDLSSFPRQADFNLPKYLGVWYELQYVLPFLEEPGMEWTDLESHMEQTVDGKIMDYMRARNGSKVCIYINREVIPTEHGWKYREDDSPYTYTVYKTDYTNYAFIYGCSDEDTKMCKDGRIWIFSREKSLSQELMNNASLMATEVCMDPLKTAKFVESCPIDPSLKNCNGKIRTELRNVFLITGSILFMAFNQFK